MKNGCWNCDEWQYHFMTEEMKCTVDADDEFLCDSNYTEAGEIAFRQRNTCKSHLNKIN